MESKGSLITQRHLLDVAKTDSVDSTLSLTSSFVRVLSRDGDPHVEFLEDGQVLKVKSVRLRDQGVYQCLARNNAGTQMRKFRLTVQGLCLSIVPQTQEHTFTNNPAVHRYYFGFKS